MKPQAARFAICLVNRGFSASLQRRRLYPIVRDEVAESHGMLRIVDESGEDYLYPARMFAPVELPKVIEKKLASVR